MNEDDDSFFGYGQEKRNGGGYDMEGNHIHEVDDNELLHLQRARSVSFLFYILHYIEQSCRFLFGLLVKPIGIPSTGKPSRMKAEELSRLLKMISLKFQTSKHLLFMRSPIFVDKLHLGLHFLLEAQLSVMTSF